MKYYTPQLPDGRWGIYHRRQLLATIGCHRSCEEIIDYLSNPHRGKPRQVDLLNKYPSTRKSRKGLLAKAS